MQLRYLFHSGFLIESEDCTIIIDYYRDKCSGERKPENGVIDDETLQKGKNVYVLSSHAHGDHFIPRIFEWADVRDDIHYLLSADIKQRVPAGLKHVNMLDVGESYRDETLQVKAFGSTDEGISFLIRTGGKTIFHAGDLNNWHWNEECGEEEAAGYESAYLKELAAIQGECRQVDAAMFPVDPRLGKDYAKGAMQFMDAIDVGVFVPMHFGNEYKAAADFAAYANEHCRQYVALARRGQAVEF